MNLDLKLNLKKPIVFLKVATTGMDAFGKKGVSQADRIIEISIIRINTDRTVKSGTRLVNPGMPIPQEASIINGITDEMVAGVPQFKDIAANLYTFIGDADFAGFSIKNFDLKFLVEEFNNAGIPFTVVGRKIIDTSTIFHSMEKRDFRVAASKFANQQLTEEPISSETANNISISIYNGMVDAYASDERFKNPNTDTLHTSFNRNNSLDVSGKIILNKDGRPVFNFGKYIGLLIGDTMIAEQNYYDWCINVSDLPGDTKVLIKQITEKAKLAGQPQNS